MARGSISAGGLTTYKQTSLLDEDGYAYFSMLGTWAINGGDTVLDGVEPIKQLIKNMHSIEYWVKEIS